tara:strand:- start:1222 stop:2580 length:1359 start_codon:yes stop_codon:yes gene_type:complete
MKKHKLLIKENKILLNEVEVSIDQILATTGVQETFLNMLDMTKVVTANIKLAVDLVFSLRSLNFKEITKNIETANRKFSRRVRSAMKNTDRLISDLSKDSYSNEAFMFTAPTLAFIDHYRKEIDDSGGIENYLEREDQLFNFGNSMKNVYDFFERTIEKATNMEFDKESNYGEDLAKLNRQRQELKDFFRENFGQGAEQLVDDIFNNEENRHTRNLSDIIESNDNDDVRAQEVYDYLNSMQESTVYLNKILIENKKSSKLKNEKILKFILKVFYEKNSKKILNIVNPLQISKSEIEERFKEDISNFEDIFIFYTDFILMVNLAKSIFDKSVNIDNLKSHTVKDSLKFIKNDKKIAKFKNQIDKIYSEIKKLNDDELLLFLISYFDKVENEDNTKQIDDFLEKSKKYSNLNVKSLNNIKEKVILLNKEYNNVNIKNLIDKLQKLKGKNEKQQV